MSEFYSFLENLSKDEQERIKRSVQHTIESIVIQSQTYTDSYLSVKQLYQKNRKP